MSQQPSQSDTSNIRASMQRRPVAVGKIEKARDPRNALIRLLPSFKPFTVTMIIVFACVVIYTLLGLVGPYLMGVAIDRFITPKQPEGLGLIALLMLVTYLFNNLFRALAELADGLGIAAGVEGYAARSVRAFAAPVDPFLRSTSGRRIDEPYDQ